jgi:NAD(P)-dependent dehydrogenase (short-subunit alcohol dehydrogenase family)
VSAAQGVPNAAGATPYFPLPQGTVVITGAGGALCGTMARALGSIGMKVVVLDLREEAARVTRDAVVAGGGEALSFGCSVLDEPGLCRVYDEVAAAWGPPEFLVNGAGGNDPKASTGVEFLETSDPGWKGEAHFLNMDMEAFERSLRLNFMGTVIPTKVFSRGMVEKGRGSIVNIASMNSVVPLTKIPAYAAGKAAVANFTKWLAVHYSHAGVRVNAIAPGFVMTEQLAFLHRDQKTGEYTPRAKRTIAHTPMGRYAEPDELVGCLLWLLSEASRFVIGDVIPIDGGFSSYTI